MTTRAEALEVVERVGATLPPWLDVVCESTAVSVAHAADWVAVQAGFPEPLPVDAAIAALGGVRALLVVPALTL